MLLLFYFDRLIMWKILFIYLFIYFAANQPFLTSKMFSTKPVITGFYLDIFQNMGTSLTLPCRVYSPLKSQLYWIDNNDNIVYGNSRMRVRI